MRVFFWYLSSHCHWIIRLGHCISALPVAILPENTRSISLLHLLTLRFRLGKLTPVTYFSGPLLNPQHVSGRPEHGSLSL